MDKNKKVILNSLYDEILQSEDANRNISVGCSVLNDFLGGGIVTGTIFEIYGESGTGKTQLAVQIMLESLYSEQFKCINAKALYLCTQKPLNLQKLDELSSAFCKRKNLDQNSEALLSALIFSRASTIADFNNIFLEEIRKLLAVGKKINVIVIDNIAALCQEFNLSGPQNLSDLNERTTFLKQTIKTLKSLAYQYNIAIITINNVIASMPEDFYQKKNKLIPCLGTLWTSLVNERIKLERKNKNLDGISKMERKLKIKLSPRLPRKEIDFVIDIDGIKGIN